MTAVVVVLAQGNQTRLADLSGPKQLIQLAACGGETLLDRMLRMASTLDPLAHRVVIGSRSTFVPHFATQRARPEVFELADPGNSSLKGLWAFLGSAMIREHIRSQDRIIVLLGDVLYSWAALRVLFDRERELVFSVSRNLSRGGGEVWGIAWNRDHHEAMLGAMERALKNHPPYDTYQPGQLRLILWDLVENPSHKLGFQCSEPTAHDDYIMDVDVPSDLEAVQVAASRAAVDKETA